MFLVRFIRSKVLFDHFTKMHIREHNMGDIRRIESSALSIGNRIEGQSITKNHLLYGIFYSMSAE